jgi:hypothetical protein
MALVFVAALIIKAIRWANIPALPPALDKYLSERLPAEIQTALERLVREGPHSRGWIAWQESFLKAQNFSAESFCQPSPGMDRP